MLRGLSRHFKAARAIPGLARTKSTAAPYAFALDIDGVLLRGGAPVSGASKALSELNKYNIPFILLTNGGGKSEKDRTEELSDKLNVEISTHQFIQSHTPFQKFTKQYQHVVVLGGDSERVRNIALAYGFENVITSIDILAKFPNIWPFHKTFDHEFQLARDFDTTRPIDAAFVFCDPWDMGLDLQILIDLLCSENGVAGTVSKDKKSGPHVYFSNPDLLWANQYHLSRLGQGAFRHSVNAVYRAVSGHDLSETNSTVIGKPSKTTYDYAHEVLEKYRRQRSGDSLSRVYMVGDNPESDIRGANDYGWHSVLVRSGVFQGGANSDKYPAKMVVNDIYEAVSKINEANSAR